MKPLQKKHALAMWVLLAVLSSVSMAEKAPVVFDASSPVADVLSPEATYEVSVPDLAPEMALRPQTSFSCEGDGDCLLKCGSNGGVCDTVDTKVGYCFCID